jgi:hypothetical protein
MKLVTVAVTLLIVAFIVTVLVASYVTSKLNESKPAVGTVEKQVPNPAAPGAP